MTGVRSLTSHPDAGCAHRKHMSSRIAHPWPTTAVTQLGGVVQGESVERTRKE